MPPKHDTSKNIQEHKVLVDISVLGSIHSASYDSNNLCSTAKVYALSWETMSPILADTPSAKCSYHRDSLGQRVATYLPFLEADNKAMSALASGEASHSLVKV
jgi:hypothetical protein